MLEFELTNRTETPLYCCALFLTSNFGAFNNMLPRMVEYIEPGKSVKLQYNAKTTLPFALNKEVEWYNWKVQTEYLKLIVNTEEFDAASLSLDALPAPVIPGEDRGTRSLRGKGLATDAEPDTEGLRGWSTQTLILRQSNPQYNNVDEEQVQKMIEDPATADFAMGLYFDASTGSNLQPIYTLNEYVKANDQTKNLLGEVINARMHQKKRKTEEATLLRFKEIVEKAYTSNPITVRDDLQKVIGKINVGLVYFVNQDYRRRKAVAHVICYGKGFAQRTELNVSAFVFAIGKRDVE